MDKSKVNCCLVMIMWVPDVIPWVPEPRVGY